MRDFESQFIALSRLFSSTVIRELSGNGRSAVFARLVRKAGNSLRLTPSSLVRDVFEAAFNVLKKRGLRHEYIYKAALTHRVLMGTHNLRTASMLSEFRVGACKADIVILNGTTTVFEIKSERDSLTRLENQIENYRKVFARVFVIAGENHVKSVLKSTDVDVGVMSLSDRYNISTLRDAADDPARICPITVFDSLRTLEAKDILCSLGKEIPDVPNTKLRRELRSLFTDIPPAIVHAQMLKTLKKTRDLQPLSSLVDQLPDSLQPAALSVRLRAADHERLISAINTPLAQALTWS